MHLCSYLVPFSDCHLAHVIPEPAESCGLPIMPGRSCARPDADLRLYLPILPVPHNNLPIESHSAHDESVFTVAVRGLIQIHEIHVNGGPGYIAMMLGVQMEQRLSEKFEAVDPHFGRRKRMTPRD